jgi:MFS family permease
MTTYLQLLKARAGYRSLFIADVVSVTGDWFSLVAISVLVARGSPQSSGVALATVLAAHLLPGAALAPVAGWLADRLDRRAVLIAGNVCEGLITIAMTLAALQNSVAGLQLLLLLRSGVAAMREPAAGAALPSLVQEHELPTANALNATAWSTTFVVGMAAGGIATEIGAVTALVIDAATFFVAALVLLSLPRLQPNYRASGRGNALAVVVGDLRLAFREARRPALRAGVFGKTPTGVAAGVSWVALNVGAQAHPWAYGAAATLGILQAVRGVGTGVGPLFARAATARFGQHSSIAHVAALVAFAGNVIVAFMHGPVSSLIGVFLWGLGGGAIWVLTQTEIQQRSSTEMRGRMLALDSLGFTVSMSASAVLFGWAIDRRLPLAPTVLVLVGLAVAMWLWIRSQPRER